MASRRAANAGSVYRERDGWIAQIRRYDEFTGKSTKIRRRAKTRDEARAKLAAMLNDAPEVGKPDQTTVADYFTQWAKERLPHTSLAPATKNGYELALRVYAAPAAGKVTLTKFTPTVAEKWLQRVRETPKRNGEPLAANTVRNIYRAAVRALDTAVRDGLLDQNPLRLIEQPKTQRVRVPVTTPAETDRLLAECQGRRIEPLVWFVAYTGCRVGEALALSWDDVDLQAGTATIRRGSQKRATTKNNKIRTLTLLPEVVEQLRANRTRQLHERLQVGPGWTDSGLVFTTASGLPVDRHNATHELQRALKKANVTTARPWHSLRHGLAARLLAKGVPLHLVSALLGHSGLAITADIYGHVNATIPQDVLANALQAPSITASDSQP